jgi:hypothetical protein
MHGFLLKEQSTDDEISALLSVEHLREMLNKLLNDE